MTCLSNPVCLQDPEKFLCFPTSFSDGTSIRKALPCVFPDLLISLRCQGHALYNGTFMEVLLVAGFLCPGWNTAGVHPATSSEMLCLPLCSCKAQSGQMECTGPAEHFSSLLGSVCYRQLGDLLSWGSKVPLRIQRTGESWTISHWKKSLPCVNYSFPFSDLPFCSKALLETADDKHLIVES